MGSETSSVELLLDRAAEGDNSARNELLEHNRPRLRKMIAARLDRRIKRRVDPSDVIQDVIQKADGRMSDYLQHRAIPFYPWLRQIAWEQLVDLHRRHVVSQKRSVRREDHPPLPDESAMQLAGRLIRGGLSPSGQLMHEELIERVQTSLSILREGDREVLVMKYIEQLSTTEIACVLQISERTVQARHRRAIQRMHELLIE
jgi:RNA polymerase sigma-70 factor (ECF subfamily)